MQSLSSCQEDLSDALSPSDLKILGQKSWLLFQKIADLKHKLALRLQELHTRNEKIELLQKQIQWMLTWIQTITSKVETKGIGVDNMVSRLENIHMTEIELILKSFNSMLTNLDQIKEENGDNELDLEKSCEDVRNKYEQLITLLEHKITKLKEIQSCKLDTETRLQEANIQLKNLQELLNESWKIKLTDKNLDDEIINKIKKEQKNLENCSKAVKSQEELLILLNDQLCDLNGIKHNIAIFVEKCSRTNAYASDKINLMEGTWQKVDQFIEQHKTLNDWIELKLSISKYDITKINLAACNKMQQDLDQIMIELEEASNLDEFNSLFRSLASEGKLDDDGKIKQMHTYTIQQWEKLITASSNSVKNLSEIQTNYKKLESNVKVEMTWLRQLDARITEQQYSSSIEDDDKRKELTLAQESLSERVIQINDVQKSYEEMLKDYPESSSLIAMGQELQTLLNDVKERLSRLLDDLCVEDCDTKEPIVRILKVDDHIQQEGREEELITQSVNIKDDDNNKEHQVEKSDNYENQSQDQVKLDQNVQVNTLKFEQDKSVQADTLSLSLTPTIPDSGFYTMSQATPVDIPELEAYENDEDSLDDNLDNKSSDKLLLELDEELEECKNKLDAIEDGIELNDDTTSMVCICFTFKFTL